MTEPTPATGPRDFTFVVPADWPRIRMRGEARKRDVDALVQTLTGRRSDRDRTAPEVRRLLDSTLAEFTADPDVVEVYLSLTVLEEVPIGASIGVGVRTEAEHLSDAEVFAAFAAGRPGTTLGGSEDAPYAVARTAQSVEVTSTRSFDTIGAQYLFVPPEATPQVLLSFSTPLVTHAEEMHAVFAAIADSFRWIR